MRIFLIGFMGCGKSTFGKKLAAKINCDFIDLDHEFEKAMGVSIRDYFAENGEEAFRKQESRILQAFNYPMNCVVATGGGTPCFYDNMKWMNRNGLTVYLEMSATALAARLEKGKAKRPLIKDLNELEIVEFIENKLAERSSFYNQAFITLSGLDITPERLKSRLFQFF